MRLSRYLESWHGTQATNKLLAVAVVAVATVTIVQSAYLMERERLVVLVPPVLQGEAVIGKSAADAPYHTAWAHLLAQMLGNVSPGNAAFLQERLEPLLDPSIFTAVSQALEQQLDQIRRDRVSLAFEPKKILHEPSTRQDVRDRPVGAHRAWSAAKPGRAHLRVPAEDRRLSGHGSASRHL